MTAVRCDLFDLHHLEANGYAFEEGGRWYATSEGARAYAHYSLTTPTWERGLRGQTHS
jgi:hypothetical protein